MDDRISNMSVKSLEKVFERMSSREGARLSLLSRNWRLKWRKQSSLVLDNNFLEENLKQERFVPSEFAKFVDRIVATRSFHISRLILHIPNLRFDEIKTKIDKCLSTARILGLRELELVNSNPKVSYQLPEFLLSPFLTKLKLDHFTIAPLQFDILRGIYLRTLVDIELANVSFTEGAFEFIFHKLPLLRNLVLNRCSGINHMCLNAECLRRFCMVRSGVVDWWWFKANDQLETIHVELESVVYDDVHNINFREFLEDNPQVRKLCLNGFALKYLYEDDLLGTRYTAGFLTCVTLVEFRVDDLHQLTSAFFLFKSCPGLSSISLEMCALAQAQTVAAYKRVATDFMNSLEDLDLNLNNLHWLEILSLKGLEVELIILRWILGHSPSLRKMALETRSGSRDERIRIVDKVMKLRRVSTNVIVETKNAG